MKPDLQRLDAAAKALKILRAAQVDYERKSDRARDNSSWARVAKLNAAMHAAAMDVERCWDRLHAALVDLGMCEPKDAAAYAQRAQHLSGFHDAAYQPAVPAVIKDCLTAGTHKEQS